MSEHWRMQLNNLLQRTIGTSALQWAAYQQGPQHNSPWKVVAYINNVEYGSGVAHVQGDAKELAAAQAYQGLYDELRKRSQWR